MYFVYHRASISQSVATNVLVYARACASACVRYRSGKSNYGHEYICTSVCLFVRQQTSVYYSPILKKSWKSVVVLV